MHHMLLTGFLVLVQGMSATLKSFSHTKHTVRKKQYESSVFNTMFAHWQLKLHDLQLLQTVSNKINF